MGTSVRLFLQYFCWAIAIAISYGLVHLSLLPGRLGNVLWISAWVPIILLNIALAWIGWTVAILAGTVFIALAIVKVRSRLFQHRSPLSKRSCRWPKRLSVLARYRPWLTPSALICLSLSLLAVGTRLPRRLAFALAEDQFQRALATPSDTSPQNFGFYTVNRSASDRRGGVYFVVNDHTSAGLWSEGYTVSHGYAYRPNASGSPFGDESYQVLRLYGDWYEFTATDSF
ncbi:MAG: hypothetical protein AAFY78_18360 [Cyanobacteria bacterium J06648_16]